MADDAVRKTLLESGKEDAVTTNQRALIDKILARYSAEFTIIRELLQNADDAEASHCQVRFETQHSNVSSSQSAPGLDLKAPLKSWTFRNDGKVFGTDDWERLRRIAEGNPDPARVGAFGVGFYSLFSICEEPVVSSGNELMGFFWKNGGDSLFTRRAKNPEAAKDVSPSGQPWTTFYMALRETGPIPESALQLTRFLATSLTFTANIRTIELWLDNTCLCKLNKTLEGIRPMAMPSHLNTYSPERVMRIERLESRGMQMTVEAKAGLWEDERERIRAEREQAARPSLTAALTKSGGLTSMLQNAFGGGGRSKGKNSGVAPKVESAAIEEDTTSRSARLLTSHSATAHLRIATSHVDVKTDSQFKRELERSTKKPPPSKTTFNVVWMNKEEYDTSNEGTSATDEIGPKIVFDGLMPRLDRLGNIFIGFRTHQTTGFSGHSAARFIPTVERESIDFIDRHCARWNMELLAVGGYTVRAIYEAELELVRKAWVSDPDDDTAKQTREKLLERALHVMRFFTMRDSSPSPRVSATLLATFFSSSRQNLLSLASMQGVKTSAQVRLPNAVLLEFLKQLPIIPPSHIEHAPEFFDQVRSRNLVKEITLEDVFQELGSRSLDVEEMTNCLRWWVNVSAHPGYDTRLRLRLLESAVVSVPATATTPQTVQSLATVEHFLNPQRIPTDVPLPPSCLAYDVSKSFTGMELSRVYGWSELSIPVWISHLARQSSSSDVSADKNIQLSPAFAEKIFGVVSRSWGNLSAKQQQETATTLLTLTCLPTKKGMHKPDQAYFSSVSLFEDLPIVEFPSLAVKGNVEKLLIALNVRRHVDLQLIFTRLVGGGDWSHVELLTYLASNRETLSSVELDRLRKTPIWPKEGEAATTNKEGKPKLIRYRASQLYEPVDSLRNLELPVLHWSSKGVSKPWRTGSEEAKFAIELGLNRHPPLDQLLALASSDKESVRSKALSYLLEKQVYRGQYKMGAAEGFAFVPCRLSKDGQPGELSRLRPTEVFTNESVAVMDFPVVTGISQSDIAKLGLQADPPASMLISRLVNDPPRTLGRARRVFEYLASVQTCFSSHDLSILKQASFVPILAGPGESTRGDLKAAGKSGEGASVRLVPPTDCYFGGNDTVEAFRSVFLYVPDLGAQANSFLRLVGVSVEPSIEEVATRLTAEPGRFYNLSGSTEAYLSLLRQIATNWSKIRAPLRGAMKQSAFLLGSKRVKNGGPASAAASKTTGQSLMDEDIDDLDGDAEEDAGMLVHALKRPAEIVIVDDANAGMIFGSSLFFAPHEDLLEQGLYAQLGSPKLSSLVEERYQTAGAVTSDSKRVNEVKGLVLERTPLFLFETRQSGNRSEIRRDAEWLKTALDVVEVGGDGLRLSRVLRFMGQQEQNVQRSSAMAQAEGRRVRLFIAANMSVDWFEVAAALNKFLLSRQRLQEVLLFMTLLSTSLRDLKRRGFHVDKILQQRKADREAYDRQVAEEQRQAQLEALSRPSEKQIKEWKQQVLSVFPDADHGHVEKLLARQKDNHVEAATNDMLSNGYPRGLEEVEKAGFNPPGAFHGNEPSTNPADGMGGAGAGGFFSSFRNRFRREGPSSLADGTSSIGRGPIKAPMGAIEGPSSSGGSASGSGSGSGPNGGIGDKPAEQPSSLDSIRRNVLSAVAASRPDNSTSMSSSNSSRPGQEVKEAESTYCDNTDVPKQLTLAGEVAGMRVFISPELDPATALPNSSAALERLINQIYRPVGAIFGLDPQSMHVFIDVSGPTIAFNRGGTIWLNLRYYLAWHDEAVQRGDVTDALISVFFSVAHEIAHNQVQEHNAQHEFYTSALCEHFFMSLAKYIFSLRS